jgi:hypothetical protein
MSLPVSAETLDEKFAPIVPYTDALETIIPKVLNCLVDNETPEEANECLTDLYQYHLLAVQGLATEMYKIGAADCLGE